jgi:hypothetical protein
MSTQHSDKRSPSLIVRDSVCSFNNTTCITNNLATMIFCTSHLS